MFRIVRCRQSGLFPTQQQSRLDTSTASSSWCAGISGNTAMKWFSGTFLLHTKDSGVHAKMKLGTGAIDGEQQTYL